MHGSQRQPRVWANEPRRHVGRAYGGVVVDATGNLLLRAPTGGYGGYAWTFAKGRPDKDEAPQAAALREVQEETGVRGAIIRGLPGWYIGDTSDTRFFLLRVCTAAPRFDRETAGIAWVRPDEARSLIAKTRTAVGRARDTAIVDAVAAWLTDRRLVLKFGYEGGCVTLFATGGGADRLWWYASQSSLGELLFDDDDEPADYNGSSLGGPFATPFDALAQTAGWQHLTPVEFNGDRDVIAELVATIGEHEGGERLMRQLRAM